MECVLLCCDKCPSMAIPSKEANIETPHTCPTICFRVYINVSQCTLRDRRPNKEHTTFIMWFIVPISDTTTQLYTHKDVVLLETSIM